MLEGISVWCLGSRWRGKCQIQYSACLLFLFVGFFFPEGVAFPIEGTGEDHVAIIEMHYDNPNNTEGES